MGVGLGHLIATIHGRLPILDPVYALYNLSTSSKHSSVYLHTTEINNAKDVTTRGFNLAFDLPINPLQKKEPVYF
jgi:hypothetical protein